jgi:hypothetical protein
VTDEKKRINVGISIGAMESGSIWDSGLNQNLAFLVMLLREIDIVGDVFLLNGGPMDRMPDSMRFDAIDAPLVRPNDVTHRLDVVIEMGVNIQMEWMRHVRALGTKIVTFYVGHSYTGQAEGPIFGKVTGATFIATPYHELWTLPHHQKASAPMLRTISRVPVHEVPYLWSPLFVQRHVEETARGGHVFGFDPKPGAPWRVAIFEPNISVVKNCFIPMLACEHAYRVDRGSIGHMMVMNSTGMKDHPTFNQFAAHLDLTRDSKASYEPRLAFVECMAVYRMDAVVAHQWECGLNNSYYDALYGGYPLIHNSEFMRDDGVGFYYPHFEATRGGEALLRARASEPGHWQDYRARSQAILARRSPTHPDNVRAYREKLLATVEGRHA